MFDTPFAGSNASNSSVTRNSILRDGYRYAHPQASSAKQAASGSLAKSANSHDDRLARPIPSARCQPRTGSL
jgi:hypothetical protein